MNHKKTFLSALLLLVTAIIYPFSVRAASDSCVPVGSPVSSNGDFGNKNIKDPSQNSAGTVFPDEASWDTGNNSRLTCDCTSSVTNSRFFSALGVLPVESTDGEKTYFKINEYLSAAVQIYVAGNYTSYKYAPFSNVDNLAREYSSDCTSGANGVTTGNKGKIDIKIIKPFVGQAFFNNIHLVDMYMNKTASAPNQAPYMLVYLNGSITVPQNCVINAGSQVVVDLGQFYSGDFNAAGQRPDGYPAKTFNVPIQCNDMSASANVTLRVQGTASTEVPDALQSDNKDVGVVITDGNGKILTPNDTSSVIPFTLDDGQRANVTLQAYAVSTTGQTPVEGLFTTLAYLRVDFS